MGIGERLRTFGFLARYKGPIGSIKRKKEQDKRKTGKYLYYYTSYFNTFLADLSFIPLVYFDSCGKPILLADKCY
jgi:hypothetical protein